MMQEEVAYTTDKEDMSSSSSGAVYKKNGFGITERTRKEKKVTDEVHDLSELDMSPSLQDTSPVQAHNQ